MAIHMLNRLRVLFCLVFCVCALFAQDAAERSITTHSTAFETGHENALSTISQLDAKIDRARARLAQIQTDLERARARISNVVNSKSADSVAKAIIPGFAGPLSENADAILSKLKELVPATGFKPADLEKVRSDIKVFNGEIERFKHEIANAQAKVEGIGQARKDALNSLNKRLQEGLKRLAANALIRQLVNQERKCLRDTKKMFEEPCPFVVEGSMGRPWSYRFLLANCRVLGRLLYGVASAVKTCATDTSAELRARGYMEELDLSGLVAAGAASESK